MGQVEKGPWEAPERRRPKIRIIDQEQEFLQRVCFEEDVLLRGWNLETMLLIAICSGVAGLGFGVMSLVLRWVS